MLAVFHWTTRFLTRYQEALAKTIAITITCVKSEAPVKTDSDIHAVLEAFTDVDTINEFKAVALFHAKAYTFS